MILEWFTAAAVLFIAAGCALLLPKLARAVSGRKQPAEKPLDKSENLGYTK